MKLQRSCPRLQINMSKAILQKEEKQRHSIPLKRTCTKNMKNSIIIINSTFDPRQFFTPKTTGERVLFPTVQLGQSPYCHVSCDLGKIV